MIDFQVGDEIEWACESNRRADKTRRFVEAHIENRIFFRCKGGTVAHDSVSFQYAQMHFRVKRTATPESFRKVFCAWTGQPATPKPQVTPLQRAKRALFEYVQRPNEISGRKFGELVDRIVEEAKAEALVDGVDVRAVGFEQVGPFDAERLVVSTLHTFAELAPSRGASLACVKLRLVRVPA